MNEKKICACDFIYQNLFDTNIKWLVYLKERERERERESLNHKTTL